MAKPRSQPEPFVPPEGWPRTSDPMRIAVIGWARLASQSREGSGYNLNASELASGLSLSGHQVFYLASGGRYVFRPGVGVRFRYWWRGIACYDSANSPNLSPSAVNFRNVRRELGSPGHTASVLGWLNKVNADVVHIHSNEGYGLDLIGAIAATGRPVVVTLHNYWYVCPQVDLLHQERYLCDDYQGGKRCVGCLDAPHPSRAVWKRRLGQLAESILGSRVAGAFKQPLKLLAKQLSENGASEDRFVVKSSTPDPQLPRGFEGDPASGGVVDHGLTLGPNEQPKDVGRVPIDQNERFLSSDVHLKVLNDYGKRRVAGVDALNRASLVTPPSDFLRRVHVAMGVEEGRTRTVRLGQPHFDQIQRRARQSPYYDVRPWNPDGSDGPLRFAFFGTMRPNKGIEVLTRAIERMDPALRQRCQFQIHAAGYAWPHRKRLSRFPEVAFFGGYDLLQLFGSWGAYHVGILPHIWFENSPLVMLEHLHGGKFVISSRLGGPPEWIVEPPPGRVEASDAGAYNGLLFAGGHDDQLARALERVARGDVPLPSPREVHAATPNLQTYPGHVREVESIYRELTRRGGAGVATDGRKPRASGTMAVS